MPASPLARAKKWRYGIILDAGSSGTRLHIYRWLDNDNARSHADKHQLKSLPAIETKNKWTEKIHPGVSTFGDKPHRVGPDHLEKLFEKARKIIPEDEVEQTPLFLLATAGMRLLEDEPCERLLEEICSYAQDKTNFQLPDCGLHIKVIAGEVEGLYGWIAANYLLGGFDSPLDHAKANDHPTFGFLDMGGASAQIAFAPSEKASKEHADDLMLMRLRTIDGTPVEYKVFTTTWLGFGVNQARKHYVENLEKAGSKKSNVLQDPCLPVGLTTSTKGDVLLPGSKEINGKTQYLNGTGQFDDCLKKTFPLLDKDHICKDDPCLIGGTHVPPIDFNVNHFVGVSEYWHTTHEIFEVGHKDKAYDFNTYQKRVSEFCSRDWSKIQESVEAHEWGKKVDEKTAIEVCFKASWLINVLHDGIGVPRVGLEDLPSSEDNGTKPLLDSASNKGIIPSFRPVNKIDDTELSWTLGKMVLYASSQVPPAHKDDLAVGFGENTPGTIPPGFQYATSPISSSSANSNHQQQSGSNNNLTNPASSSPPLSTTSSTWASQVHHTATVRRLPGLLLFLLIFGLILFYLCGRSRRHRIASRFSPAPSSSRFFGQSTTSSGPSLKRAGLFASTLPSFLRPSSSSSSSHLGAYERILEDGGGGGRIGSSSAVASAADDFELNGFVDSLEDNIYPGNGGGASSDSSNGSGRGKNTSGWATPRLRNGNNLGGTSASRRGSSEALSALGIVNLGDPGGSALGGRRSERASPSRQRGEGMSTGERKGLGSLIED